jgi:signal transduction histidine kinase
LPSRATVDFRLLFLGGRTVQKQNSGTGELGILLSLRGKLTASLRARCHALRTRLRARDARADVLAAAPIPILVLRGHALVVDGANPASSKLLGDGDVLESSLRELLPEIEEQAPYRTLCDLAAGKGNIIRGEGDLALRSRGRSSSGTAYWRLSYAHLDEQRPDGSLVVAFTEITEQVAEPMALRQAVSEAKAESRAKERFLAMLSHELRQPLAPILTTLQLISARGFRRRDLALLERQVARVSRLVDDLLDIGRVKSGTLTIEKRRLELSDLVAAAVETVKPLLAERAHRLTVEVSTGLCVEADLDRMCQVVVNLLSNAARYSEPRSEISITAERRHGTVRLSVADEGIGIEPERLEHVFDMFVRNNIDRTVNDRSGLGLGLTIVRELVHLHGGHVHAHSRGRGQGSVFVVELPSSPNESRRCTAPEAKLAP